MNHPLHHGSATAVQPARCPPAPQLIGEHPLMQQIRRLVSRVATTDVTVLVHGDSGTGKEVVARMIHAQSARADQPFIAVNCGAIPAELLESEMFGHERGSFTGAVAARAGMFQLAHGGTIFLDEVSEMSPALQVKLLRVVQEREVRPVGSDRSVRVDVRIVAATNKDLEREIAAGRFREDLYYRLNVVPISMPPLRERRSDVPLLVEHYLERHTRRHHREGVRVTEEAMVHLWEYDWPGNVRELENLLERLVILCEGEVVRAEDLPPALRTFISRRAIPDVKLSEAGVDLNSVVEEFENGLIRKALDRTGGNKQAAARLLGVNRTTLVAKLRRREDLFGPLGRVDDDQPLQVCA
ncbi:MAG: sigma-54 dependent transcriptional regulator [Thermodesulfobacteriota bacterium]